MRESGRVEADDSFKGCGFCVCVSVYLSVNHERGRER